METSPGDPGLTCGTDNDIDALLDFSSYDWLRDYQIDESTFAFIQPTVRRHHYHLQRV